MTRKTLWKIPLPQKILQFIWKVLHSALPVRNTLIHRGLNCFDTCPFCQEERETLDHLFLKCPFARAVWLGSEITIRTDTLPYHTISDWISNWVEGSQKENRIKNCIPTLFVTLWCIWNHRNGIVFEGKLPYAREVMLTSNALTLRYNAAYSANLTGQDQTSKEDTQHLTPVWPDQEAWQLLYLVEISSKVVRGRRVAALIGKSKEGCQIVRNAFLTEFQDPKKAKLAAIREALLYTAHLGLQRMVILTESKEIQLFWRSKSHWPWWIDSLLDDIQNIVKQYSMLVFLRTSDSILSDCRKLANMIARQTPNSVL